MAVAIPLRRSVEDAQIAHLYKAHAAELLRFAWHRLGRLEDAEDAVQSTFLSAHRVLLEGERVFEPRAWLFRILRNECLTRIAMAKRRGPVEELGEWHADPSQSVVEQVEGRDDFDQAVALLASLPEQQREAMVLREWVGLSAIETADILDSTPQGVDALVYRARKALVAASTAEAVGACIDVREALAADAVTARERAHLLACRSCRAASRRLRAPEELAVNGALPLDGIAARLGESIPGFAAGGVVAAAAAGGGAAAAAATGIGVKVAAGVAIGAMVVGGGVDVVPVVDTDVRSPVRVRAAVPPVEPPRVAVSGGEARIAAPAASEAANAAPLVVAAPVVEAAPAPVAVAVPEALAQPPVDASPAAPEPVADAPKSEAPNGGGANADTPRVESPKPPKAEAPKGDGAKADAPKGDGAKADAPKGDGAKLATPKPDAPKVEPPKPAKAEAPRGDAAKAETPKAEAPKAEAPKGESPKAEGPKVETPKPPKAETPKAETPKADAPKADGAKSDTPKRNADAGDEPAR